MAVYGAILFPMLVCTAFLILAASCILKGNVPLVCMYKQEQWLWICLPMNWLALISQLHLCSRQSANWFATKTALINLKQCGVDFATPTVPIYKLFVDIKFKWDKLKLLGAPWSNWLNGSIRQCIISWVNNLNGIDV